MLEILESSLFADKLVEDTREPLTTFEIPGLDGTFGLFPPTLGIWQQLLYVSMYASAVVTSVLWIVLFALTHKHGLSPFDGYSSC